MRPDLTDEAVERAWRTSRAARLFFDNAAPIATVCEMAEFYHVVVATVGPDLNFEGADAVLLAYLTDYVAERDNGGWTLVFDPKTTAPEIERRALAMARSATRRWEIMKKRLEANSAE